ncbi:MAG TPA: chemotaxis protein CheB [Bryobacteraceae bacterium]|jgi:two-component system chemotaxis response regulator CheB
MPKHDIIAIGASAGGVEAIQQLCAQFPPALEAVVFVVIHIPQRMRSLLPAILSRCGPLPAVEAADGMPIQPGRIYIAPPDLHLEVERGHIRLSGGPKEQHCRPAINVTFRSAALAYGERVVGVILTGEMDDGIAGLWEIKRRGGIAIVQNPEEAFYPSMPLSALRELAVDYTVRLAEIGPLLCRLALGEGEGKRTSLEKEAMEPTLTDLTCPECRGTIWEVPRGDGNAFEYRCRVGHTYSPTTMLTAAWSTQENVLYSAIVALEEGASLANRLVDKFHPDLRQQLLQESRDRQAEAEVLRKLLAERRTFNIY